MQQDKIWEYFQNEGLDHEQFPIERQRFLASKIRSNEKVLNIGVGSGMLEKLLTEQGISIYSLDPSERAIERLRSELRMGDRAQAGYGQAIPFPDAQFDVVVMSELIEHLNDQTIDDIAKETFRVLKPGGYALVTTPYNERLSNSSTVCPDCGKVYHRVGHVQSFLSERAEGFFTKKGFKIDRSYVTTFVDWKRPGLKNWLKSIVRLTLARLREDIADPHIVFYARRPRS